MQSWDQSPVKAHNGASVQRASRLVASALEYLCLITHIPRRKTDEECMREFFEKTFGPAELSIVDAVFTAWLAESGIAKETPEAELAAAAVINLFREGNDTRNSLTAAVSRHCYLAELKAVAPAPVS